MSVDLGELMRERSATAVTADEDRLAQVHGRIRRRRRRRTAGTAVMAVVAVGALVAGFGLLRAAPSELPQPATPTPTPTLGTIDGFPEYGNGARFVASQTVQLPRTMASVTVVPEHLDLTYAVWCDPSMWAVVRVNGRELVSSDCDDADPSPSVVFINGPGLFAELGLTVGGEATFTAEVTHVNEYTASGRVERPLPESGTIAFAVYQRVSYDEYVFPPRPSTLPNFDTPPTDMLALDLPSDPADPLRPRSATLAWHPDAQLYTQMLGPGYLHVFINGIPAMTREHWDYVSNSHFIRLGDLRGIVDETDRSTLTFAEGEIVTITVEPQYTTEAWRLWVVPPEPS